MRRRRAHFPIVAAALLCGAVVLVAHFLPAGQGALEQGFLSKRRALPELGTFQIRDGYVSSLVAGGREYVNDPVNDDGRWFLNNPLSAGGVGNFGFTVWGERRSLSYPSVVHGDPVLIDNGLGLAQFHRFAEGFAVNTRWTWTATSLALLASVYVRPGVFVKEPEFAVALKGVDSVTIPACRTYLVRPDADPRRSTGHCDDPDRSSFDAGPFHFDIDDAQIRDLGRQARDWPARGEGGCGWRPFGPSWEIVAWHGAVTVLAKSWDGCTYSTDAVGWFRSAPERRRFDFTLTITRNGEQQ